MQRAPDGPRAHAPNVSKMSMRRKERPLVLDAAPKNVVALPLVALPLPAKIAQLEEVQAFPAVN